MIFVKFMYFIFRYLATGESLRSLAMQYRVSRSSICHIIPEVCEAIWTEMKSDYMKFPTSKEEWKTIAEEFDTLWQFPHCCGAIDGKHIRMICPNNTGSLYYSKYKSCFSIVLMACVDASSRFIFIDVGNYGSNNDSGIFSHSNFGSAIKDGKVGLPDAELVHGLEKYGKMPYTFIGDEGFPLLTNLMKPVPGTNIPERERIYNYRLSRARRIVECAFGKLANRWRILHTKIDVQPEGAKKIVKACCVLHNFLIQKDNGVVNANENVTRAENPCEASKRVSAVEVRNKFIEFFNEDGHVSWQTDKVREGL